MNLSEILKQFKMIESDPAYREKSRRAILAMPQAQTGIRFGVLRFLETGVALVLGGFFILLITGGIVGEQLSPVQYSVVDPQGLRAEAQAVDLQIQLANIKYDEVATGMSVATSAAESTPAILGPSRITAPKQPAPSAATSTPAGTEATSTSSSTLSIDQALEELSK